jgi:hypothetical protein
MRVRLDDGTVTEIVMHYAGGQSASVQFSKPQSFTSACNSAFQASKRAFADLLLPEALGAQAYQCTGSDCWKFQRVGATEVHSIPGPGNSECGNFALNLGLKVGGAMVASITAYGLSETPSLLMQGKALHVAMQRVIAANPTALAYAATAVAGAFVGGIAVGYFDCAVHRVDERQRCRSSVPSGGASPVFPTPGPMGWATGLSTAYVRGTNDRFWGIPTNTN